MKPVKQTKLYAEDAIGAGNCFAAALASLLELPLWMVPPFEEMFHRSDWKDRLDEWLARMCRVQLVRLDGHQPEQLPEYYIASGLSPRGVRHSVIYRGIDLESRRADVLCHDPHPSGGGIESVEWTWHLEPIA